MKKIEAKVVIEFTHEEASIIGSWIQWEMGDPAHSNYSGLVDILTELGTKLLPENEQD